MLARDIWLCNICAGAGNLSMFNMHRLVICNDMHSRAICVVARYASACDMRQHALCTGSPYSPEFTNARHEHVGDMHRRAIRSGMQYTPARNIRRCAMGAHGGMRWRCYTPGQRGAVSGMLALLLRCARLQ